MEQSGMSRIVLARNGIWYGPFETVEQAKAYGDRLSKRDTSSDMKGYAGMVHNFKSKEQYEHLMRSQELTGPYKE